VIGARVTDYCAKALEQFSDSAEKIVDGVGHRTSSSIKRVAARVSNVGGARVARYVGFAGQVSLPPLKLARDVSAWIATRTEGSLAPHAVKHRVVKKTRSVKKAAKKSRAA
jgi:hypothetical protein